MELSNLKIVNLDNKFAKEFFEKYHYTHSCNLLIISYGFYYEGDLKCVVGYSRPSGKNLAKSIWKDGNDYNTLELIRLFSFDDCPKNTESFCISQSIKALKNDLPEVKILVSYADSSAGHIGYIYQASNWKYIGTGSNERKIFIDGERQHRRSLYGKYGTSSVVQLKEMFGDRLQVSDDRFPKNKYIYVIGKNKFETKQIYTELNVETQQYPKGQIKYYDEGQSEFNLV